MKRFQLRSRKRLPTCPYCHAEILEVEHTRPCAQCGTKHHLECSRELERCAVMGCGLAFPKPLATHATPPGPYTFSTDGLGDWSLLDTWALTAALDAVFELICTILWWWV